MRRSMRPPSGSTSDLISISTPRLARVRPLGHNNSHAIVSSWRRFTKPIGLKIVVPRISANAISELKETVMAAMKRTLAAGDFCNTATTLGVGALVAPATGAHGIRRIERPRRDLSRCQSRFAPSLRLQRRRHQRHLAAPDRAADRHGLHATKICRHARRLVGVSGAKMDFSAQAQHPLPQRCATDVERHCLLDRAHENRQAQPAGG